ncbi:MAG: chromosomal replication initiator protein DnaA [Acholeplasmataceae bacterium]|nr:chromosomal replication initiator protein DnaA [Acholeplasmataceae bacterium]
MEQYLKLWEQVLNVVRQNLDDERFNELFRDYSVYKFQNNYIFVVVPDVLTKFRIEKFLIKRINQEILPNFTNDKIMFKIITKEEAEEDKKQSEYNKLVNPTKDYTNNLSRRNLRPEYTFSNFVVGESNRFAFLSAMKVAEAPGDVYNPLYIFGDVGLGKTHLMMAIGHYILDNNINANVIYTTAQQFTEDYFLATSTKKGRENIEEFYNYYRSADVLLVDDIQFLDGKKSTQEEFFKVFEYLHENNKQIVITSDRSANQLQNMMARLKSRFNWGLNVDIKTPDNDLRINILKTKLKFLLNNPAEVPIEVLEYISNTFPNNVRDLEGALRRYVTYCVSLNIPFTLENVYVALDSLIPNKENDTQIENNSQIEYIKQVVCDYFKISTNDLTSTSRKQQVTYARQIAIYLIRDKFNIPLKRIGEFFGNRDHATISHSIDKIKHGIQTNPLIKTDIEILEKKIQKI